MKKRMTDKCSIPRIEIHYFIRFISARTYCYIFMCVSKCVRSPSITWITSVCLYLFHNFVRIWFQKAISDFFVKCLSNFRFELRLFSLLAYFPLLSITIFMFIFIFGITLVVVVNFVPKGQSMFYLFFSLFECFCICVSSFVLVYVLYIFACFWIYICTFNKQIRTGCKHDEECDNACQQPIAVAQDKYSNKTNISET